MKNVLLSMVVVLVLVILASPANAATLYHQRDDGAGGLENSYLYDDTGSSVMRSAYNLILDYDLTVSSDLWLYGGNLGDSGGDSRLSFTDGGNLYLHDESGVPVLTIDTGGNVGIGDVGPSDKLDVAGDLRLQGGDLKDSYGYSRLSFTSTGNTYLYHRYNAIALTLETSGEVGIADTTPDAKLDVYNSGVGLSFRVDDAPNDTTPFVIDADGDVGIGTSAPGYKLEVSGGNTRLDDYVFIKDYDGDAGDTRLISRDGNILVWSGGLIVGQYSNGSPPFWSGHGKLAVTVQGYKPGGGSWASLSDERLKKNIQPLTGALDAITQLRGVHYEWINAEEHQAGPQVGFLAQELEAVFPNWVDEGLQPTGLDQELIPDGEPVKAVALPGAFNAYLVEAIKELRDENQVLRDEIWELRQMFCQALPENPACAFSE